MGMWRETVDNTTEQSTLNELAHDAYLRLDVTSLDLARLPPHVNAELQTEARTFEAPALVSCAGDNPRPLGYEIPCAATARGQKHPRAARLNV